MVEQFKQRWVPDNDTETIADVCNFMMSTDWTLRSITYGSYTRLTDDAGHPFKRVLDGWLLLFVRRDPDLTDAETEP